MWRFWAAVALLGGMQIFAWGSVYYAPAVLLPHLLADTGWSASFLLGGVSLALLAGGLCTPLAARAIAAGRGAWCLGGSSLLFALGLTCLAKAHSPAAFVASWLLLGAGMGCGLYDAAFSILSMGCGADRQRARKAITALTLVGGLASTVAWPVLSALAEAWGWREACLALAGVHATAGLAVNAALAGWCFAPADDKGSKGSKSLKDLKDSKSLARQTLPQGEVEGEAECGQGVDGPFAALVCAFSLLAFVSVAFSSNILGLFQGLGATATMAVQAALWFGPAQVAARLVELCWGRRWHPRWTALAGGTLLCCGLAVLALFGGLRAGMVCGVVAYGAGNGLLTIARGTLPLALYPRHYVRRLGVQARCILCSQAVAPLAVGLLWEPLSSLGVLALLLGLACTALVSLVCVVLPQRGAQPYPA